MREIHLRALLLLTCKIIILYEYERLNIQMCTQNITGAKHELLFIELHISNKRTAKNGIHCTMNESNKSNSIELSWSEPTKHHGHTLNKRIFLHTERRKINASPL